MKCIILILLPVIIYAEDAKPQPPEVIRALAAYEKIVVSSRMMYDASNAKAVNVALADLEKAKIAYTQKGDLEGANLVVAAIKSLVDGETRTAIEANMKNALIENNNPAPENFMPFIGVPLINDNGSVTITIFKNGTCTHQLFGPGTWVFDYKLKQLVLKWPRSGTVDYLSAPVNGIMSGHNAGGTWNGTLKRKP